MSLANQEYREKRRFIRMKVDTPAQLTATDIQASYSALCHDVSGGGMLLAINQEIAMDTELVVTIKAAHDNSPMLEARCSVARIEPGPKETYLVGLEISEILNAP